jgi:hypothetical protein
MLLMAGCPTGQHCGDDLSSISHSQPKSVTAHSPQHLFSTPATASRAGQHALRLEVGLLPKYRMRTLHCAEDARRMQGAQLQLRERGSQAICAGLKFSKLARPDVRSMLFDHEAYSNMHV